MMPLMLVVACANVYGGCIAMAHWDAVIHPYQFDPQGEAPEEVQNMLLSLFVGVVIVTTKDVFVSNSVSKLLDTVRIVSVSSLHMFLDFLLWQPSSIVILLTLNSLQLVGNCKYYHTHLWLRCSCWVWYGWDWSFYEGQCRGKASFVLTLVTEAVWCEAISTHTYTQAIMNRSRHAVVKNEMPPLSLLLFCSWDRI